MTLKVKDDTICGNFTNVWKLNKLVNCLVVLLSRCILAACEAGGEQMKVNYRRSEIHLAADMSEHGASVSCLCICGGAGLIAEHRDWIQ